MTVLGKDFGVLRNQDKDKLFPTKKTQAQETVLRLYLLTVNYFGTEVRPKSDL